MIRNFLKNKFSLETYYKTKVGTILSLLLLPTTFLTQNAIAQENWARGPIEIRDIFPLNIGRLNYNPKSTKIENKISVSAHLANTENTNRGRYIIDAETRELAFKFKKTLSSDLEFSFELPLFWQGAGFLDNLIFDWHKFWGLPQGPRRENRSNSYNVSSSNFDIESSGVKTGDIRTGIKKLLTKGDNIFPAISSSIEFRLPTGSNSFSPGGIDLIADLLLSKKFNSLVLYSGLYYSYFSDPEFNQIQFERNSYGGFVSLEYLYSDLLSIILSTTARSNLTSDIELFPDHQIYTDLGFKYGLKQNLELELNIRENPSPSRGSSDFSTSIAVSFFY